MATSGFKFLAEKALQTAEELSHSKFGHEEIADTLVKIVKECPAPFTVGLFAKWGSGKSTVANSLKIKLPKQNIPVVIFDVWKHEGDALRRTFLKESLRQLRESGSHLFDQDFELDERLQQSISRSAESRFIFPREKLQQLAWPIILGLFGIGIVAWVSYYFGYFDIYKYFLTALFGSATAGGLLILLIKNTLQFFTTETVSYGVDKFEDPHQFEEEFGNLLTALKYPRILIIFDNLDRVDHDKVVEVLSTIKTFLEPQDLANNEREVIFLIPCDARAIKQHLSSVYNPADKIGIKSAFDPDEFLRKFFNTIVWIPDFIPSELESFAQSRLKETGVELLDNHYVAWIITKAFRSNPRQIIQFINILLANYLLVEERAGAGKDFPADFLKENIPQLTKYLVLNQLFPDEMDILRERKILDLNDIDQQELKTITKAQFAAFIEQTNTIPITDLRTFFTLRRSEQEKKFPGFETLIAHLEDRNTEDAAKYFDQIGDLAKVDLMTDFSQAIKEELESKTNPVSSINLIHTLLVILSEKKTVLASTLYEEINNILAGRCKEELHTISPDILNDAFLTRNTKYRKTVVPQWITVIDDVLSGPNTHKSDKDYVRKIITIFATQPDYLGADQKTKVRNLLVNHLANDIETAKILVKSPEAQDALVTAEYLRNFASNIPAGGAIDDVSSRVEVLNKFTTALLTQVDGEVLIRKFIDLQVGENQNSKPETYPEKKKLLDQYREFLRAHGPILSSVSAATKDAFADVLNAGFNAPADHQIRSVFVPVLFEMRDLLSPPKKDETERFVSSWLGNVSSDALEVAYRDLSPDTQALFFDVQSIFDTAANRGLADQVFRDNFFGLLNNSRKQQFLERILNYDLDKAIAFFDTLNTKDVNHVFAIAEKIWSKYDGANSDQKRKIFSFINKHKANGEAVIRETLATKIGACLMTMDQALQKVGLGAFEEATLSKELTRKIVKETFDWLKKPEISPKCQPSLIHAVAIGFEELNQEEKNEFVHFLFDEILRKSDQAAHIAETSLVLQALKPKYEDRKSNFDDIKLRIESEGNVALKKALVEGIAGLMPFKTNKENEEYWKWAEVEKGNIAPK